jgi:hypothetical protein
MVAGSEECSPAAGNLKPRRHGPERGTLPRLPVAASEEHGAVTGTLLSLVQLCLSELRADLARLLESGWAEPERKRACELARVLDQACEQQGLRRLALVVRSVAMLAGLSSKDAMPLETELRAKFKELLLLAEKCLLKSVHSPACA